ncbi:hypothetical protein BDV98DRAFT_212511, partial [Pterulicium gracile]
MAFSAQKSTTRRCRKATSGLSLFSLWFLLIILFHFHHLTCIISLCIFLHLSIVPLIVLCFFDCLSLLCLFIIWFQAALCLEYIETNP